MRFSIKSMFLIMLVIAISLAVERIFTMLGFISGGTGFYLLALREQNANLSSYEKAVVIWTLTTLASGFYGFVGALLVYYPNGINPLAWGLFCLTFVGILLGIAIMSCRICCIALQRKIQSTPNDQKSQK